MILEKTETDAQLHEGQLSEPLDAVLDRAPDEWCELIQQWRQTLTGCTLVSFVDARVATDAVVYPAQVLRALELTPLSEIKVVVVGQDPYHGPKQAHGLAFSVPNGVQAPPSLRNILTELRRDLGVKHPGGDLSGWARQGVLLLNTSLTVEQGLPASHAGRGWEGLTERLLKTVAQRPRSCAYLLWGGHAQKFEGLIRSSSSKATPPLILKANHPSPLAAHRPPIPFIGCGHFGKVVRYLAERSQNIDWGQ